MNFTSAKELLKICKNESLPISAVMKQREITEGSLSESQIEEKLDTILTIMRESTHEPIKNPRKSMGGLIGGEAKKIIDHQKANSHIAGEFLSNAIAYTMAVQEKNASMGLVVAAPTAGSAGVVPGLLFALGEDKKLSEEAIKNGVLTASAIGYLLMLNATVSGAEAGCQAEIGAASAMAAAAAVEVMGGTPNMCLDAASTALSNLLGLVCDPIAGFVESPCQTRDALGVANAITCAELALSGITFAIPFDEMADAMYAVGKCLSPALRETAIGGCAGTPTGKAIACQRHNSVSNSAEE